MTYLSEDPTYLAGALLLVAGACLIALNVTKQGKHLINAGIAVGIALAVLLIEWMWVTDNERIEMVVYDVRTAVLNSDAEAVIAHLAPQAMYLQGDTALSPDATRALIRNNVSQVRLEFARITQLQTSVGQQSRRGKAEFRVFTRGSLKTSSNTTDGDRAIITSWSLGFQETKPGIWKITRISPLSIPRGILALPGKLVPSDGSHIGLNDAIVVPRSLGRSISRPSPRRRTIAGVPTIAGPLSRSRRDRGRGPRRDDSLLPSSASQNN
jgi:ketosteroid isomerase-like protein